MRLLLDSHTLIWAADDPGKLPALAKSLILDPSNERLISAATIWEMAIKVSLGKLPLSLPYRQWMEKAMATYGSACWRLPWSMLSGTQGYRSITVIRSTAAGVSIACGRNRAGER